MRTKHPMRGIVISGMIMLLSLGNYLRLTGTEMIRPIHIVTLLTCGAAIGVLISSIFYFLKNNKDK
jgi:uncharacterized membrane protein